MLSEMPKIGRTSWGFALFQWGRMLPGTERETSEEVEQDFEEVLSKEISKLSEI